MIYTALIGNPVEHSVSPALFGMYADITGVEYAHLKINVEHENDLIGTLNALKTLGFAGINVTLPYKLSVSPYIDIVNETARSAGAFNTLVFKNNKTHGYNTDGLGALRSIEEQIRPLTPQDKVLVLGAGGAARAIISSLLPKVDSINVLNRDKNEAQKLIDHFSNPKLNHEQLNEDNIENYLKKSTIIINATSVGMHPDENISLISEVSMQRIGIKNKIFFDAVFNPYETKLLQDAKKNGASICPGIYMMIYQGIQAFQLWTNEKVPPLSHLPAIVKSLRLQMAQTPNN